MPKKSYSLEIPESLEWLCTHSPEGTTHLEMETKVNEACEFLKEMAEALDNLNREFYLTDSQFKGSLNYKTSKEVLERFRNWK